MKASMHIAHTILLVSIFQEAFADCKLTTRMKGMTNVHVQCMSQAIVLIISFFRIPKQCIESKEKDLQ